MIHRMGVVVICAALLSACGAGEPSTGSRWVGTIDTLPNGAVVVKNPAHGVWGEADAWRIEEELRIGTADEEGPEMFGNVAALEVDDLGRIFVLDGQASEVRVFDASGEHVRTFGRQGGGPGELYRPAGLFWGRDGNLWIADLRNSRFSVFDTTGTYVTSHRRLAAGVNIPWGGGIDAEGRIHDRAFTRDGPLLLRFDSLMQPVDTFPLPRFDNPDATFTHTITQGGQTAVMRIGVPFAPRMVHYVDRQSILWFGVNDRFRIVGQVLGGDTVRIIEKDFEPAPVTQADREAAMESLGFFSRQGGQVDPSKIPATKPAFTEFLIDDQGYFWFAPGARNSDEGWVFDVFDPEGRYLGRTRSNVRLGNLSTVRIRGEYLYGVTRDELDVPYVVRARILGR